MWLRFIDRLRKFEDVFNIELSRNGSLVDGCVMLNSSLETPEERTNAIGTVIKHLGPLIPGIRNEVLIVVACHDFKFQPCFSNLAIYLKLLPDVGNMVNTCMNVPHTNFPPSSISWQTLLLVLYSFSFSIKKQTNYFVKSPRLNIIKWVLGLWYEKAFFSLGVFSSWYKKELFLGNFTIYVLSCEVFVMVMIIYLSLMKINKDTSDSCFLLSLLPL